MNISEAERLVKKSYPKWEIFSAAENDTAYVFLGVYFGPDESAISNIAVDKDDGSVHLLIPRTSESKHYLPENTNVLWTECYEPGYEKTPDRGYKPPEKYVEALDDKIEQLLISILRKEGMNEDIDETMGFINHAEWDIGISIGFDALLSRRIRLDTKSLDLFGRFAHQYAEDERYLEDEFIELYEGFKNL
ncbi:hypothetical protein [Bifidobacterium vansinderenii]|uniref:Uncharacterized protein n=1 Tax=Bifidobacterium vansinderenii TaxID=1984871 RepID=A0A229VZK8_9BIFI|nr:hypothetical protein [Bifidobacterium vansinderenii]OXN01048.1 hypothetical protein Tam10B_0626 [Bifidobacterium vansinderenii]